MALLPNAFNVHLRSGKTAFVKLEDFSEEQKQEVVKIISDLESCDWITIGLKKFQVKHIEYIEYSEVYETS